MPRHPTATTGFSLGAHTERNRERHIVAPFDLRPNLSIISRKENMDFFNATFPGNKGYTEDGLCLYIHIDTPPQPPPKSFAGVPVVFVAPCNTPLPSPDDFILPRGFGVSIRQGTIATDLDYRSTRPADWGPLFDAVRLHFDHIQIPITEVIYYGILVHVVLEDDKTDRARLPQGAGKLSLRYLFETEMKRPVVPQASAGEHLTNAMYVGDYGDQARLRHGLAAPKQFDVVHFHMSETDLLDGQVLASSRRRMPGDGAVDGQHWVANDWIYMGSEGGPWFPDSMCGAVAYDSDGRVSSFVQYAFTEGPWKGWCVGPSAEELRRQGFS